MKKKSDNASYIKVFIVIVLFSALVSLTYKVFLLVKNRSFRFNTYNIILVGRDAHLEGFNIFKKQIYTLELKDGREVFSSNKPLASSVISGVPLDGMIISIKGVNLTDLKNEFPTFGQTLSFLLEDEKYVFYNINKFDLVKLYVVSRLTVWEDKSYDTIRDISQDFSREKFYDSEIFNEKTSLEIINSTKINGLGSRIGFILSNLGANVISIKDGEDKKTQVLAKDLNSKTLKRIEKLFELKAQKDDNARVADITLNLGEDLEWK